MRLLIALLLVTLPVAASAKAPPPGGGMVSAADPRAAEAGREMLRQGGTATDAAIAMMLALTVVEPQSSGIGGGGFFVHHEGRTGRIDTIDGRETAPASATPDRWLGPDGKPMAFATAYPGGLSVGVPGNLRLAERAHMRWGTLQWPALFKPAIKLADDGFLVTPRLYEALSKNNQVNAAFPAIRALYYQADGTPKPVGTRIRVPELAKTLRLLAKRGAGSFYQGAIAGSIVQAVAAAPVNKAVITPADLATYEAKERPAVCGPYRGYRICSMGPPSSGAVAILQMLGMLERFDMQRYGPASAVSWHLIGEAMRLAYADRGKYLGDPGFVEVPVAGLIDPDYLARRSRLIRIDATLAKAEPGTPPGAPGRVAAISGEVPSTTNFVAADGWGDVLSWTSTVEGAFGSQLMASGFILNNELTDFSFAPRGVDSSLVANRVQPGKRPMSSMSPTIVYGPDGKVVLALGSAGGPRIIMHVMKTLVGVLDWKLPVQDAIALPNIFLSGDRLLVEQGTALEALRPELEKLGHVVGTGELISKVNAIERTPAGWRGGADPRSEGEALAQ